MGVRAVLDAVVKRKIPSPRRESNPRIPIVQLIAHCYTDFAITAHEMECNNITYKGTGHWEDLDVGWRITLR
jgi:hypothetical protein